MERTTYEVEAEVERNHWWFRGRRRLLARFIESLAPRLPPDARILDVGCGTGANGPVLAAAGRVVVGLDASAIPLGLHGRSRRGHDARVRGDASALPFSPETFDLVVALDVLEHLDDDRAGTSELFRVLRPGGAVIVFVPALRILWGLQDDVSHHRRRYRRSELIAVVESAGFEITRTTYFNTLLFAPILAARLAMRVRRPRSLRSENEIGAGAINSVLAAVFGTESVMLGVTSFPIGVSLACVARRKA